MLVKTKDVLAAVRELLAVALLEVFPQTKILETYRTDLGFGLDCVLKDPLDESGFRLIDERLRFLLSKERLIEPVSMMRENAAELFRHRDQGFLAERILQDSRNVVPLIRIGDFYGFSCITTQKLSANSLGTAKLVAYAQSEPNITSLEGVVCDSAASLKKFLKKYRAAEKVGHQLLGPRLKLFFHPQNAVDGCWTWLPKGESLKELLLSIWREQHLASGFSFIATSKWFKKGSDKNGLIRFSSLSGPDMEYSPKRSTVLQELVRITEKTPPLRFAEIAESFSFQRKRKNSGLLNGSVFTQDLAYTICAREQVMRELISSLQFLAKSINMFAIDHQWCLVSRYRQGAGNRASRARGIDMLAEALKKCGYRYSHDFNESLDGGPRIEARLIDALEREWGGPWIELSDEMAVREGCCPVLITRSLYGSLERFIAVLVEHYEGGFPLWLAPEQARVIPVKEANLQHAQHVYLQLLQHRIRASLDVSNAPLAKKIYNAKAAKIPYAVVIGDKEQSKGNVAAQSLEGVEEKLNLDAFVLRLHREMSYIPKQENGSQKRIES